jgi:hypothetical protein
MLFNFKVVKSGTDVVTIQNKSHKSLILHAKRPQYLCYCMLHSELHHKSNSKILTICSEKAFNYGQKFGTSTLEKKTLSE